MIIFLAALFGFMGSASTATITVPNDVAYSATPLSPKELPLYVGRWQNEFTSEIIDIHQDPDGLWIRMAGEDCIMDRRIYLTRRGNHIYSNMSPHELRWLPDSCWRLHYSEFEPIIDYHCYYIIDRWRLLPGRRLRTFRMDDEKTYAANPWLKRKRHTPDEKSCPTDFLEGMSIRDQRRFKVVTYKRDNVYTYRRIGLAPNDVFGQMPK